MQVCRRRVCILMVWCASECTGAEKAGFPGVTHGLFQRGEIELVEFFYRTANERLCIILAEQQQDKYVRNVTSCSMVNYYVLRQVC